MPNSDINKNFLALEELEENIEGIDLKKIKRILNDNHQLQVEYASNIKDLEKNLEEKENKKNKENIGKYAKNIIAKFYIDSIKEKIEPLIRDKRNLNVEDIQYSIRGFKSLDKTKRNTISLFIKKIKENDFKNNIEENLYLHWNNSIAEIKEIEEKELSEKDAKTTEVASTLSASHDKTSHLSIASLSRETEADKSTQTDESFSSDSLDGLSKITSAEITSVAATQNEYCEGSEKRLSYSFLDSARSEKKEMLSSEDEPSISHNGSFFCPSEFNEEPSQSPSLRSKDNLCEYASCQIL